MRRPPSLLSCSASPNAPRLTSLAHRPTRAADDSKSAGWQNPSSAVGPGKGGEAVGHESGRHIVRILRANPSRAEDGYPDEGDDDLQHMARVVAYCKRHLAQEEKANEGKGDDELQETKSYRSLKNWCVPRPACCARPLRRKMLTTRPSFLRLRASNRGHDALKKRHGESSTPAKRKAPASKKEADDEPAEDEGDKGTEEDAEGEEDAEPDDGDAEGEEDAEREDAEEEGDDGDEEPDAEGEEEDEDAAKNAEEDSGEPQTKKAKRS